MSEGGLRESDVPYVPWSLSLSELPETDSPTGRHDPVQRRRRGPSGLS